MPESTKDFKDSMIQTCPVGCLTQLVPTDIILPEGPLRCCPECGQLVSACTPDRYTLSMQSFDVESGTMPDENSSIRHRQRIGKILSKAIKTLAKPASNLHFLDVGCSSGSVLLIARDLGIGNIVGVEPASKAAGTARSLGFDVIAGTLDEANFPSNSFDLITLFEVIEHLDSPLGLAREVFRTLKPGGIWLIGTGNAKSWTTSRLLEKWEYFSISHNGGHISFFNPTSIQLLAQRSGFELAYLTTKRVVLSQGSKHPHIKIAEECLALPARLLGKGHDMLAALRKPE